ncbi:MAG: type II toxin-antitoxin system RelE/ParE family toxin [Paracoccaceae bacterium]
MAYRVLRSADTDRDLEAIFDFLFDAALALGESPETALERAAARLLAIEAAMAGLGRAPHQGTLRPEIAPGLRHVTKDRAVFYFDVDDAAELVRVLAVFFGGQDHRRRMLLRLLSRDGGT